MIKSHFLLIALFVCFGYVVNAQSVDSLSKNHLNNDFFLDTLKMNDIVITSTRTERRVKDVPVQTYVIDSKEIVASGMNKLEDVLSSQLTGMEFHQAGYGTSMTFQGLDARHILILVDGERLSGDVNGNVDFSKIPTESIERIEIVKGSSSVLYGSNAMGATINIITKTPKNGFEGSAYYSFGGFNQMNKIEEQSGLNADIPNMTAAGYFGYNNKKLVTTTDVTYQGVDPYRMVSKHAERREYFIMGGENVDQILYVPVDSTGISISGWHSLALNHKTIYKFNNHLTAKVKAGYTWKNRYDLGDYSSSPMVNNEGIVPIENYQGFNVDAYLLYDINKEHHIDFSFHTTSTFRKQDSLSFITPKQRNNISVARILYNTTSIKKNNLSVGMDFSSEVLSLDLTAGGYDDKYSFNSFSLYAQDEYNVTDKFDILLGLRFDNFGFSSCKEFFGNIFNKSNRGADDNISLTPQLALKYNFDRVILRANYAMGFRTPSLKERYMEYYQPYMGMTIVGNPNLVAERNNYFSLSADYMAKRGKLYLSANVYANLFKNKIDTYQDVDLGELVYMNTAQSELYGVDLGVRAVILDGWWINGSYAFSYRNESGPVNSAQYIFASPHTISLQTNYMMNVGKWDLGYNISANYYSPKTYEDMMPTIINNSGSLVPDIIEGVYRGRLEGYILCNFAFNATLNSRLTLSAGVDNFLNYTPSIASFNSAVTSGVTGFISARILF